MIKKFIKALIQDLLYDLNEVKKGNLKLFRDVILHYSTWVGGLVIIHVFLLYLSYLLVISNIAFYQSVIGFTVLLATFFLVWFFAGKLYGESPDRPVIEGINDDSRLPRWLR